MANTKSALKRILVNERRRIRNKGVRSGTRTMVNRARQEVDAGKSMEDSAVAVKKAIVALDRAVAKGVIHSNNAARRKSRLMKRLNSAFSS